MDEMQRSSPNGRFDDDEQLREAFSDDEEQNTDREANPTVRDIVPITRISPVNTRSSEHVVGMFAVQTLLTETPPRTDWTIDSHRTRTKRAALHVGNTSERKTEEKLDSNTWNRYLNEHDHFLKLIDHSRQLTPDERKQLDRQKEELRKLQFKLALHVEDDDRKRQYQIKKETEALRRKHAYQQRRLAEAKLKESRKPLIQTTFRMPVQQKHSKSQPTRQDGSKANRMELSNFIDDVSDANSSVSARYHDTGTSLRELMVQTVEHSKRSWQNDSIPED